MAGFFDGGVLVRSPFSKSERSALLTLVLWCSLLPLASPVRAERVSSLDGRFSLDLPAGWSVGHSDVPAISRFHAPTCAADGQPGDGCEVFVVVHPLGAPPGGTSADLFRKRSEGLKATIHQLSEGHLTVAGESVPYAIQDYKLGKPVRHFHLNVVRNGQGWDFTGWAPPDQFAKFEAAFRAIAESLRFR
jgi:hypothetical protein